MNHSERLATDDLRKIYRWMVLTRAFEDRICDLWARGKAEECPHGSQGQEAIAIGACYGLHPRDQVLPSLRTRGAFLVKGIPTRVQMAAVYARANGAAGGKFTAHHMGDPKVGVIIGSGIVGASITVAVGAALAMRLQKRDDIVVDFFGDGAAQRGDFHEGLNFAGVFKLPILFVLENNQFAEFTALSKHFAGSDFASRAVGYGFPGHRVDGNDVFAVYDAVQEAARRARAGEGPTLLECVTYRQRAHCEVDRPEDFRDAAEIESWRRKDPLVRLRAQLRERGVLTDDLMAQIERDVEAEIEDAVEYADQSPFPRPEDLTTHVYAPELPELVAGRRQ